MSPVVEGRAASDDCVLAGGEGFDDLAWARCCRDDSLRPVSEPQAQHRLIEGVGLAPGGELVAPQFHVLLAPEPVGLLGREQLAHRAVRPFEPKVRGKKWGRSSARQQARMPDSPLTMMSRASAMVAPMRLTIG